MSRQPDEKLPPGPYLLALVYCERKRGRDSGNEYLRCRFVVCSGPKKGQGFFCNWGLDVSKAGCLRRWELWMEQVGCDEELDTDSDRMIAKNFKGKPFKAEIKTTQRGEYTNTDIARLVYPRLYTARDHLAIAEWDKEWRERGWEQQDPGRDPGPSGDDAPPPPESEPQWSKGSGFGDDDGDAPF